MKPAAAKKIFLALALILAGLLVVSAWKLTSALERIEEVQSAFEDLQVRRFPVAAQLRARIQRLNSTLFRHQVTGDPALQERFASLEGQLSRFFDERRPMLDDVAEREILQRIEDGAGLYLTEAGKLMAARQRNAEADQAAMRIERIVEMADEIVELTNELALSRTEHFRALLQDYRDSVHDLQRSITVSLLLTLAAVGGLGWVSWKWFLRPVQSELQAARALAGQREELANIGTLASGIAHEIRNPITAMKARAFALAELVEPGSAAAKQAAIIDKELVRMERVVRDFLDFARPAEPDLQPVDLDAFLAEIVEFLRPEMEQRDLVLSFEARPGAAARMDSDQIKQALLNLIRNAAEASKEGGGITLKAEVVEGRARISVADRGAGIAAECRDRLFVPFFSKKHGGTGLGLSIARNIARKHGGDLAFETAEGEGTTFTLDLMADGEG